MHDLVRDARDLRPLDYKVIKVQSPCTCRPGFPLRLLNDANAHTASKLSLRRPV